MENKGKNQGITRRGLLAGMAAMAGTSLLAAGCTPSAKGSASAESGASGAGFGSGMGKKGEIKVRAIVESGQLADIVVESEETPELGTAAQDILKNEIISNQTLNVDMVSGATVTSMAYVSAVKDALSGAGQKASEWEKRDKALRTREGEIPSSADVVVVGSGVAGMSAAVVAAKAGKQVVVLERLGVFGGNSIISGAGYAAPNTWAQVQQGIEDSPEIMAEDMVISSGGEGDPALIKVVCDNALDSMEWLIYEANVPWSGGASHEGGHTAARVSGPSGRGEAVMAGLLARARKAKIPLISNIRADKLDVEAGKVVGISATDQLSGESCSISAGSVIIATGGFGYNVEMRKKHDPALDETYGCTNCIGAMGDGITMVEEIGGGVADLQYIQVHPTCSSTDGSMLSTGGLRGGGRAILVNKEGKRFVEELEQRDVVSQGILAQTDGLGYFVFSKKSGKASFTPPVVMKNDKQYVEGETLEEACGHFGIDAAALAQTIQTWNADAAAGQDSQFSYRAEMFPIEDEGPYAIFSLVPSVHYTMGGITINPDAAVLDTEGKVIEGLFAAGETCGNIMGVNRLGCTSYPNAVVFGRVAGKSASAV